MSLTAKMSQHLKGYGKLPGRTQTGTRKYFYGYEVSKEKVKELSRN